MDIRIPFNKPLVLGSEVSYMEKAVAQGKICGDGEYTKKVAALIEAGFEVKKALLTTSCTAALELAAILLDLQQGDEVIMPSYTFVSTANAFVLRGARIAFVDIDPKTMNIDVNRIEAAITSKTKAIVPVHYAGVGCEMDAILKIADEHGLIVVEDAAQGVMAQYKGRALGSIGDLGCYSFHETKNYTMGEGGAICLNREKYFERAEIVREKGTDRSKFLRGQVDKYTWCEAGSSLLPSDINAAFLYPQLQNAEPVNDARLEIWRTYYEGLEQLQRGGVIELPYIPDWCEHNAHMFYIKTANAEERTSLIKHLQAYGIQSAFHYVPLHTSSAGKKYGHFVGEDKYTTRESERLLRLPMFFGLSKEDVQYVCEIISLFYKNVN